MASPKIGAAGTGVTSVTPAPIFSPERRPARGTGAKCGIESPGEHEFRDHVPEGWQGDPSVWDKRMFRPPADNRTGAPGSASSSVREAGPAGLSCRRSGLMPSRVFSPVCRVIAFDQSEPGEVLQVVAHRGRSHRDQFCGIGHGEDRAANNSSRTRQRGGWLTLCVNHPVIAVHRIETHVRNRARVRWNPIEHRNEVGDGQILYALEIGDQH